MRTIRSLPSEAFVIRLRFFQPEEFAAGSDRDGNRVVHDVWHRGPGWGGQTVSAFEVKPGGRSVPRDGQQVPGSIHI